MLPAGLDLPVLRAPEHDHDERNTIILDHSQLYPEPSAATISCQQCLHLTVSNWRPGTALLTVPSGKFPLNNMFDSWKHDVVYPNKNLQHQM